MSETSTETSTESESTSTETTGGTWTPPASQADLDRIIADRVARTKAQFKDYNDLKTKAAEYDRLAESQKTEAQKAQDRAEAAEKAAAAATERAVRAEIKAIATGEFADPTDAYLYLGDLSRFIDKSGDVDSDAIEAALKEVEKAKPHLVARARTDAGLGARNGSESLSPHQHMNQQIRQAAGR